MGHCNAAANHSSSRSCNHMPDIRIDCVLNNRCESRETSTKWQNRLRFFGSVIGESAKDDSPLSLSLSVHPRPMFIFIPDIVIVIAIMYSLLISSFLYVFHIRGGETPPIKDWIDADERARTPIASSLSSPYNRKIFLIEKILDRPFPR